MATGVPATIASGLIDRLNSLRVRHKDDLGNDLDQVRFSVRALKNADYDAYLAVSSMIASLSGNTDELESIAREMDGRTASFTSRLNLLLSLSMSKCRTATWELAKDLIDDAPDLYTATQITDSVLSSGSFSLVRDLAERHSKQRGFPIEFYEDVRVADAFERCGIDEKAFSEFLDSTKNTLKKLGWPTAPILISERTSCYDDSCGGFARFLISAEPDTAQEVEERFMDELIAQNEPLFMTGKIACSISVRSSADE